MPLHAIIGHAGSGGASGGSGGGGDSDGGRTAAAATVVTAIVPAAVAAAAAAVPIMVLRLHSIYVGYVSGRARRRSWCCACTVYICVIKVSYHKHVCFFDKCSHLLAEWISDFYGIDFPRRAFRGMVFRACLRNGFPSHFLQRNGFRSGFGNIILLAYTDGYSIPPSTDGLRHDLGA